MIDIFKNCCLFAVLSMALIYFPGSHLTLFSKSAKVDGGTAYNKQNKHYTVL